MLAGSTSAVAMSLLLPIASLASLTHPDAAASVQSNTPITVTAGILFTG